mmetsp:Transcript_109144/g.315348  ORF Transcript_109144/g.315348 Transcript_109144/m.315348 type:complete len:474 (+) Transcript_109144:44-1465(+)
MAARCSVRLDQRLVFPGGPDAEAQAADSLSSSGSPIFGGVACGAVGLCSEAAELARFEAAKQSANVGFASSVAGARLLANTLLGGTGMLGIPHAFAAAGYLVGASCMMFFVCCSAFGSHLLSCSARRIGQAPCSFYTVAGAVAPRWTWLIDSAVMIKCFGVAVSYLMIVGDLAPDALRYFGAREVSRQTCVTAAFLIGGSLACFNNLSALRHSAIVSLVIVLWTVGLLGLYTLAPTRLFNPCSRDAWEVSAGLGAKSSCRHEPLVSTPGSGLLPFAKAMPVFIFGFTCQQNVFAVCNEVKNATRSRIDGAIVAAYSFAFLAFLFAALFGYVTYGDEVQSDVLKGYPRTLPVEATRLLYSLLVSFSFPLQVHPSRTSALALWGLAAGRAEGPQRFWTATAILLISALLVALRFEELGVVLAIVGATGSTMVSYILPGLIYVQAFPERHTKRLFALLLLALGCIIMPSCLAVTFL